MIRGYSVGDFTVGLWNDNHSKHTYIIFISSLRIVQKSYSSHALSCSVRCRHWLPVGWWCEAARSKDKPYSLCGRPTGYSFCSRLRSYSFCSRLTRYSFCGRPTSYSFCWCAPRAVGAMNEERRTGEDWRTMNDGMVSPRAGCVFYSGSRWSACSVIGSLVESVGVARDPAGQPALPLVSWRSW
jgi:hypothetical protein